MTENTMSGGALDAPGEPAGDAARNSSEAPAPNPLHAILAVAVHQAAESVMVTAPNGAILYVNPAFERLTGYSADEVAGQNPRLLKSGRHDAAFYEQFWSTITSGQSFRADVTNRRKDGRLYTEEHTVTPVRTASGEVACHISIATDVTEKRRAEREVQLLLTLGKAIAEADDFESALALTLREICQLTGWDYGEAWVPAAEGDLIVPIPVWYGSGPVIDIFRERTAGYTFAKGQGLPGRVWETRAPEWHRDTSALPADSFPRSAIAAELGIRAGFGVPITDRGEVLAVLDFFLLEAREEDAEMVSIVATAAAELGALVRRKRAELDLARTSERLAVTLRSIGDGVITTDSRGIVERLNPVAEALTGWDQASAAGQPLSDVFQIVNEFTREPSENPVHRALESGRAVGLANHTVLISRDGSEYILNDSAAPIRGNDGDIQGVVLVFRDVTAEKRLEDELQKASKLEALGVLAGGIAHDFNNSLAALVTHIGLVRMSFPEDSEAARQLREAEQACLRATSLTRQLLTFARGGAPMRRPMAVAESVRQSAMFALTGANVTCEFDFPPDLWPALADEGQLGQVISNLAINAQQAMPAGGVIRVSAANVEVEGGSGIPGLPPGPGRFVRVTVSDEGVGIPADIISRIFDPYFTTKQKGSGLGLAAAYSIVRSHDGHLAVESQPGRGAHFHAYLPAADEPAVPEEVPVATPPAGTGRILFMDDEESIRRVIGQLLRRFGHDVTLARDGAEAVDLYSRALRSAEPFDLVLLDLTVPGGIGGKAAMERLIAIDPGVRAIVSSGYSNDSVMSDFASYGFRGVIAKPYSPDELLHVVSESLNAATS